MRCDENLHYLEVWFLKKYLYRIQMLPLADEIDAKVLVRCVMMWYFFSEVLSLSTK